MSELRVDSVKSKGGGAPDLPKGVTISGITTAVTLGATQIDGSNVNVSGVVTSGTLSGSLLSTGTPTLGLGVTINSSGVAISGVATAGIVSATTLYGDGTNITGLGATLAPLFYNPDPYDSGLTFGTGIGLTFNQQVKAGTGNVTLRLVGAAGTVVENFGVGSSVTISENRITIDPTADLSVDTIYHISYPSGCFTNNEGSDYVGTAYTFQARGYDYQLWAWGQNTYGSSAQNNRTDRSSPIQISGTNWRHVFGSGAVGYSVAGTKTDGTLWMWGYNQYGGLGQNDIVHRSSPTQVPGTTWSDNVTTASSPGNPTAAVKTDGTLWVWGRGNYGQLGDNSVVSKSSPVQIPGTTWSTAADTMDGAAEQRMGCIKTDGTLWMWGRNQQGTLGLNQNGANTNLSSPTQVPGTTWSNLVMSQYITMAVKTDGTLWTWGWGNPGHLGQNDRTARSSPVQIPGTTWATGENKLSNSGVGSFAMKTDGTLWAWGARYMGVLGPNAPGPAEYGSGGGVSSPVQIPGTTWDQVAAQGYSVAARKTDGSLWAWGYADNGNLGQNNTTIRYSSPVQIGTDTDWSKINSGQYQSFATKRV